MHAQRLRTTALCIAMMVFIVLLPACAPKLPEGQISGDIVRNGQPAKGFPMALAKLPEMGTTGEIQTMTKNTDDTGHFVFENMPSGSYLVLVLGVSENNPGLNAVLKGENQYIFELTDGKGVDLGEIEINKTEPFLPLNQ